MDPVTGFFATGASGIATNLATEIVKHYLQRLDKTSFAPALKHIGLIPPNQQDQLRSTINAALVLLQQSEKQYELSSLEEFFDDPVIGQYICETILSHQETADPSVLQPAIEEYLRKSSISYLVFLKRGGKPEHILPDFFRCFERVMQEQLGPSELALLHEIFKSQDVLRSSIEGLKLYFDMQLNKYAISASNFSPSSLQLSASSKGQTSTNSPNTQHSHADDNLALQSVEDIAYFIRSHRHISEPIALVLGARTGSLYGNDTLYSVVKKKCLPLDSFDALTENGKFREVYKVLQQFFSQSEVDTLLKESLYNFPVAEEDRLLAELIRLGYFETVISTSLDLSLEGALHGEEARAQFAYNFVIHGRESVEDIIQPYRAGSKIIKLFGVVRSNRDSRYNGPGNEFELDSKGHKELRGFLEETFSKNVLLIGYDFTWDSPINNAFLAPRSGNIYYINEANLIEDDYLERVIKRRQGRYLLGPQKGHYGAFIQELHQQLINK